MNICIVCQNKSKDFNQYCYNCNVPIKTEMIYLEQPFNIYIYDNLKDNEINIMDVSQDGLSETKYVLFIPEKMIEDLPEVIF